MFKCKPHEFMIVRVYKPNVDRSFEYIARIIYIDRKNNKQRTELEIYAFDTYNTLASFLREQGFLNAGRDKDDDFEILETWI